MTLRIPDIDSSPRSIQNAMAIPMETVMNQATVVNPTTRDAMDAHLAANKEIVRDFLENTINQGNFAAAAVHFGPQYVQHNPMIRDGIEGIRKHMTDLRKQFPELRAEVKRLVAEGDLVIAHLHARRTPIDPGLAIVDVFRLDGGKLVEHWEVRQPVPETAVHDNGMF